ncbi:hypothetical protein B0H19DRAFT_1256724 [Mycena capillaripes]|nr:hypothetical protein B0H19DRAFT_1256724 [Mycena capillaripes]
MCALGEATSPWCYGTAARARQCHTTWISAPTSGPGALYLAAALSAFQRCPLLSENPRRRGTRSIPQRASNASVWNAADDSATCCSKLYSGQSVCPLHALSILSEWWAAVLSSADSHHLYGYSEKSRGGGAYEEYEDGIPYHFVQIDSHASRTPLSMSKFGRGHASRRRLSNVDWIRHLLMCHSDMSPLLQWDPKTNFTELNTDTPHSCKNFDAVKEWGMQNTLVKKWDRTVYVQDDIPAPSSIY